MDMSTTGYETTASTPVNGTVALLMMAGYIALIVLMVAAVWKLFKKAGQPGWAALVPFYNSYVTCKIAGRPDWFFLLLFVPFVNIVAIILLSLDMAKVFGKSTVFAVVGLILFAPIGYMMLGFGKATYSGPLNTGGAPVTPEMPAQNPPTAPTPPPTA